MSQDLTQGPTSPMPTKTVGDRAVSRSFNPSSIPAVDEVKALYARIIDVLNEQRADPKHDGEAKRYMSKAISYTEDASYNAVKGLTHHLS